jgi:hypothetical protein
MHFFGQTVSPTVELGSCFVGKKAGFLGLRRREETSVEMFEVGFTLGDHRGCMNASAHGALDVGTWS